MGKEKIKTRPEKQSIEQITLNFKEFCKNQITEGYADGNLFSWLENSELTFSYKFQEVFRNNWPHANKEPLCTLFWYAGKNLIYAIQAYMISQPEAQLDEILKYTGNFIDRQVLRMEFDFDEI